MECSQERGFDYKIFIHSNSILHCSGVHSGVGGHGEHVGRVGAAAGGEATLCVFMSETVIGLNGQSGS